MATQRIAWPLTPVRLRAEKLLTKLNVADNNQTNHCGREEEIHGSLQGQSESFS